MSAEYANKRTDEEILELLTECATDEWQDDARVVGNAMYAHELKYNGEKIGDGILEEYLRRFAADGHFEIDDPSLRYGKYKVRLAAKGKP